MKKAIFIDRDGTINEEVGYLSDIGRFSLLKRSGEAIRLINESGFLAVVITNQSGVARGFYDEAFVNSVHERMKSLLKEKGAHVDGVYYCPHHPEVGEEPYRQKCGCRKPEPGMLKLAQKELDIDLANSFVVGDKISDIQLAHKAGTRCVLVLSGYGRESQEEMGNSPEFKPDHIADDLYDAVKWIIGSLKLHLI